MSPSLRSAALAAVLCASSAASARAQCAWPAPAAALEDGPDAFTRVWTAPSAGALLAGAPPAPAALARYREWARWRADVDPRALLRRQLELYRRLGVKDGAAKLQAVLDGRAGRLERMNCLETLLFAEHEARFPVEDTQSEFLAVVLRRGPELRVYLLSQRGEPGVGPGLGAVEPRLRADAAAGWALDATLHNHPFMFDNPYGDISGVLVPSGDAQGGDLASFQRLAREYGMREAWITNGFDSVRLGAADDDLLVRLAAAP